MSELQGWIIIGILALQLVAWIAHQTPWGLRIFIRTMERERANIAPEPYRPVTTAKMSEGGRG